jgi:dephospho-CoA kinase
MLRVGLTGGIASGKSTAGAMFVELGCRYFDSDKLTHELLAEGPVHDAVVREFGTADRKALGAIVFSDPSARAKLNALTHPEIIRRQQEWLKEMAAQDSGGIAIVDAALMIETGNYKNYDKIVVVACPPEIQRERLRRRGGLTEEQIESRIRSQMPVEEKVKVADYVIDTSGPMEQTRTQVEDVFRKLGQSPPLHIFD